jgi:hypothetical protein
LIVLFHDQLFDVFVVDFVEQVNEENKNDIKHEQQLLMDYVYVNLLDSLENFVEMELVETLE